MGLFYTPAVSGTLAFLPLALIDFVRLSNRFAGPMQQLRRTMQELSRGEPVEPIRFRKGDFWHEFAADFNVLVDRVQCRLPGAASA